MPIKSWGDLLQDAGGADGGFEPIPPNDYDFYISKAEASQTGNGKSMFKCQCKVESGPLAGKVVFQNFVVSPENPNALAIFFRQMNVLGLGRDFFAQNPSDEAVAAALANKRFRGTVVMKQYNGQDRNEIKSFNTPGPAPAAQAGPAVTGSVPAPQAAPAPQPPAAPPAPAAPQAAPPPPAAPAAPPAAPAPPAPAPAAPAPEAQAPAAPPPPPAAPAAGGDVPPPPPF